MFYNNVLLFFTHIDALSFMLRIDTVQAFQRGSRRQGTRADSSEDHTCILLISFFFFLNCGILTEGKIGV